VDDVTALYKGMLDLAQEYGVAIVGGDISRAPIVAITITILGASPKKQFLTRSTAKPGEVVAVTGYLGAADAGLEMLTKKLKFDPPATACFKQAFLYPYPRIAEGQLLLEQGVKTAIDISDGLISDLGHIGQNSRVGARIEAYRVPIEPMVKTEFGERALELALTGGEDYELLFTAGAEVMDKIKRSASCPITVIGEIIAGKGVTVVDRRGNPIKLDKAGWEHFTTK
jgi:thiamine-monophosphate kinase